MSMRTGRQVRRRRRFTAPLAATATTVAGGRANTIRRTVSGTDRSIRLEVLETSRSAYRFKTEATAVTACEATRAGPGTCDECTPQSRRGDGLDALEEGSRETKASIPIRGRARRQRGKRDARLRKHAAKQRKRASTERSSPPKKDFYARGKRVSGSFGSRQ